MLHTITVDEKCCFTSLNKRSLTDSPPAINTLFISLPTSVFRTPSITELSGQSASYIINITLQGAAIASSSQSNSL